MIIIKGSIISIDAVSPRIGSKYLNIEISLSGGEKLSFEADGNQVNELNSLVKRGKLRKNNTTIMVNICPSN